MINLHISRFCVVCVKHITETLKRILKIHKILLYGFYLINVLLGVLLGVKLLFFNLKSVLLSSAKYSKYISLSEISKNQNLHKQNRIKWVYNKKHKSSGYCLMLNNNKDSKHVSITIYVDRLKDMLKSLSLDLDSS